MVEDKHPSENVDVAYDVLQPMIQFTHIQFKDIKYSVQNYKYGVWPSDSKKILHGVSGRFEGGKMTAIIGESGSGKTSLLDIVSGYRSKGFSGLVLMDGVSLDSKALIKRTCYIPQNVILQPLLTTYEAIMFVVNMIFTSTIPQNEKKARVYVILEKSMLSHCKNTLTKNLSDGERKRLALALELISDPSCILVDELISGLDSRSARECLKILRNLSDRGRTVVCSVHQPSMQLLQLFDNLYIMWRGHCVYQGTVENLVHFLAANSFECPRYHNPTEYLLELCVLDGEDNGDMLVKTIDNGRSLDWMTKANEANSVSEETIQSQETFSRSSFVFEEPIQQLKISSRPSFVYQFWCMLTRKVLMTHRDLFCWLMMVTSLGEGLAFGLLFYDKGKDARWMIYNYNMIFLIVVSVLYNGLTSQIINFPLEIQFTKREYLNGWYHFTAYWLSLSTSIIPIAIIPTIGMGATFYYLVGYPVDGFRISRFLIVLVLLAILSQDYGILLGTLLSVQKGLVLGILTTTPMMVFSGFFVYNRDCRVDPCRWMFKFSPLRRVFQETLFSAYGYDRGTLYCDLVTCPFEKPNDFFQLVDMEVYEETFWSSLIYVAVLCVATKLAALAAVKYKCSRGI